MDISPKALNILALLHLRGSSSIDRATIREIADNESRAEFAVDMNEFDATFLRETLEYDPIRAAQKRMDYEAALDELVLLGALAATGDAFEVQSQDFLEEASALHQSRIVAPS